MKDNKKALDAYEKLASSLPGDTDVQYALGSLYLDAGNHDKARPLFAKVLKSDPNNLAALLQAGWLEVDAGNPQAGLDLLNRALTLAVQLDNQEQKAVILQALGIAYEHMNKFNDAIDSIQKSMEINKTLKKPVGVANNLVELGNVMAAIGKPDEALANYNKALDLRREIGAKKDAASTLLSIGGLMEDRGQYDKALALYKESLQTQRDSGDLFMQGVCLNDIGSVYLAKGQNEDAITYYQQALQIREKLSANLDTADTLHNLGEAYTKTAQYDQAMTTFMRALQLHRTSSAVQGAALDSHSIGMIFLYQGRLGAAVNSLKESLQGFRDAKDRSRLMAQVLIDYADALTRAGRADEVGNTLEEAQALASELKNEKLTADVHNTRGDMAFFAGDLKTAKDNYQQGLQFATRGKAPEIVLISKLGLARVAVAEGRSQAAVSDLKSLTQEADRQGMKYVGLVSSVELASAMINVKDYPHAQQQLDQALNTSEKLGTRLQTATIHYLLGKLAEQSGNASASQNQYRQAANLFEEMKKEPGAERLLDRSDLKVMYKAATPNAQQAKN